MMDDVYYLSQLQYTTASTQQGYPALTPSYAQPSRALYAGSAYSTDPSYPVGSSHTTPYLSDSTRPNEYRNESPRDDPYRKPFGYATAQKPNQGRTPDLRDPRQDPTLEAGYAPSRDTARMDPRMDSQGIAQGYGNSSIADISTGPVIAPPPPLIGSGMEPYPPPRAPVYDPYRNESVRDVRPGPGRENASYAHAPATSLQGGGMELYPPPRAPVYDSYRDEPVRDVRPKMRDNDGRTK